MRHILFALALIAAAITALPMSIVFFMSECQLLGNHALVDRCFERNSAGSKAYFATLLLATALAIALHLTRKRWAWAALLAIPLAPLAVLVILF